MPGPPPKPTRRRQLEGNPGKRKYNPHEPQYPPPDPDAFDAPPPSLDRHPVARAEWDRIVPILRKARAISDADRNALAALCVEWARYVAATDAAAAAGLITPTASGYPMISPYLSIANRSLNACRALWSELGLTPASRARVSTYGNSPSGAADPFAEFDEPPRRSSH